jgi:hypothetical protein
VHVLSSAPPGSAWTFGGSILTFAFPMILFIVVACALYVLYTKPELVPGHWIREAERPVSYTPVPGPGEEAATGAGGTAGTGEAPPTNTGQAAETDAGQAAGTEDVE